MQALEETFCRSGEELQNEVDRLNRKFHKRLTIERYLKLRKKVLDRAFFYDALEEPKKQVENYLEGQRRGFQDNG